MANLNSQMDKTLIPRSGDQSGKIQKIPVPAPVTKENFPNVFTKSAPDVKKEGRAASTAKAILNKGGSERVSD